MYTDRERLYQDLESQRDSKLLVYVTGDRPGLETRISSEVLDYFTDHLDKIGKTKRISLYLYTRGGETLAAWTIANLIMQFCEQFEVIVPSKALSAGTLICLGANSVVMTKQAILGPIDPSVNTPLNPQVPGAPPHAKVPVSVEAIQGYLAAAETELKISDQQCLTTVFLKLSSEVHPLVLGQVYRTRSQIQSLAKRLIVNQVTDATKHDKIVSFLCSESGSHDYTINRREARDSLGLAIEKPDDKLYATIKEVYNDIRNELELNDVFDPMRSLGGGQSKGYSFRRGLIESIPGKSHVFVTEGTLHKQTVTLPDGTSRVMVSDDRQFEGWRHEIPE